MEGIEGPRRLWRDPFVIAFVLGAAVITGLPLVQRLALRAPAPLEKLGAWSLTEVSSDATLGSNALGGKVLLVGFVPHPCDVDCTEGLSKLASAPTHVKDLGDKIVVLGFVQPGAVEVAQATRVGAGSSGAAEGAVPSWKLLSGAPEALAPVWSTFERSWDAQLQSLTERRIRFLARPTLAVVDQDGAIRGFWPADDEGRGHAINAARMFARYGTEP